MFHKRLEWVDVLLPCALLSQLINHVSPLARYVIVYMVVVPGFAVMEKICLCDVIFTFWVKQDVLAKYSIFHVEECEYDQLCAETMTDVSDCSARNSIYFFGSILVM